MVVTPVPQSGDSSPVTVPAANATLTPIVSYTAALTSGSPIVTVSSTGSITVGDPVSGTGIPQGTLVASIDSGTQLHLSVNATTSQNSTLTFGGAITAISLSGVAFASGYTGGRVVVSGTGTGFAGTVTCRVRPAGDGQRGLPRE